MFPYGNDVRALAHQRKLPKIDVLIAGVPCQPFSKANTSKEDPRYRLRDERELFTAIEAILHRLDWPDYVVECTPFVGHLQEDFQEVARMLGEPTLHDLSLHCPQKRLRY